MTALLAVIATVPDPSSDANGKDAAENNTGERVKGVPPRDPTTKKSLIDLSSCYNGSLREGWLPSTVAGTTAQKAFPIPFGVSKFDGLDFDVRGVVQLSGNRMKQAGGEFPEKVLDIRAGLKCKRLHFLHAAGWAANNYVPLGTQIGTYVVHYADNSEREIPIVTGENLRDWVPHDEDEVSQGTVVWKDKTPGGLTARIYKCQWENPQSEIEIKSIDFVSKMTDASPFLIAITAE